MGLVTLDTLNLSDKIVVEISDFVSGGTKIKRKAELVKLEYSLQEKRVGIHISIIPYAVGPVDADGNETYGDPLVNTSFGMFPNQNSSFNITFKQLIANNTTIVDAATGELLGESSLINDPIATTTGVLAGKNYMLEFDFYKMVAGTQDVNIDTLITNKIKQADDAGRL